jgi:hypothetical protein
VANLVDVLDLASRCVLAFTGRRGPVISPLAFWSDGAALWASTPAVSVKARALRARPECAVYIPPFGGATEGAVIAGRARVYGLHDPLGLALHGAVVTTAMAALAARNTGTILGYVQDAAAVPTRFRPQHRVAVRIAIEDLRTVRPPEPAGGVAPALPTQIAPGVRRALSGRRAVTLAVEHPGGSLSIHPVTWDAGFAISAQPGEHLPHGAAAAAYVGTDPQNRPTAVAGLSLAGELVDNRLHASRATWWEGFDLRTVELPAVASSITLPD